MSTHDVEQEQLTSSRLPCAGGCDADAIGLYPPNLRVVPHGLEAHIQETPSGHLVGCFFIDFTFTSTTLDNSEIIRIIKRIHQRLLSKAVDLDADFGLPEASTANSDVSQNYTQHDKMREEFLLNYQRSTNIINVAPARDCDELFGEVFSLQSSCSFHDGKAFLHIYILCQPYKRLNVRSRDRIAYVFREFLEFDDNIKVHYNPDYLDKPSYFDKGMNKRRYRRENERPHPDKPADADENRGRKRKTVRLTEAESAMARVLEERLGEDFNALTRRLLFLEFERVTSPAEAHTSNLDVHIGDTASAGLRSAERIPPALSPSESPLFCSGGERHKLANLSIPATEELHASIKNIAKTRGYSNAEYLRRGAFLASLYPSLLSSDSVNALEAAYRRTLGKSGPKRRREIHP